MRPSSDQKWEHNLPIYVGGGEGKNQGRMGNQGTFDTVPYGLRVDAVAVECRDISTMRVAGIPRRRLVA